MKKLFTISIILSFMSTNSAFALENELTLETLKPVNIHPVEVKEVQEEVTPPKWEEYVPKKYINSGTDFRLTSAIIELDAETTLITAENIQNPEEKKLYYKNLLKECKLKEKIVKSIKKTG